MKDLESELARQRHSRKYKSQSDFLRNFPNIGMTSIAKSIIKPVTSTINHASPLISLLGGHTGHVVNAVSGIIDKLV
jgi:hypothetical protein